jgi:putative transcriptional regulator
MGPNVKASGELRGNARLRAEIVEMTQTLHEVGAVSDEELVQTAKALLGPNAQSRVPEMSPEEIVALRKTEGLTRDRMAAFLNVATSTVSQWERGVRRPTGAALKLLHVVKHNGVAALG